MKEIYNLRMLQALRWTALTQTITFTAFAVIFQLILGLLKLDNLAVRPFSFWFRILIYVATIFTLCICFQKDSRILQTKGYKMTSFTSTNLWTGFSIMLAGAFTNWSYLSFILPYNYTVMYTQCQTQNKVCVNEIFVFIFTLGLWQGLDYFLNSYVFKQNEVHGFHVNQETSVHQDIHKTLPKLFINSFKGTFKSSFFYIFLYIIFRDIIIGFYSQVLFVYVDQKMSLISNVHFILIALITNTMFLYCVNFILYIFNTVLSKRYIFTVPDLFKALSGNNILPCIKKLAYLDLMYLTEKDTQRRKEIFKLSQPGGHPHNWIFIKEKCIATITEYMKLLDTEHVEQDNPQPNLTINNSHVYAHLNIRPLIKDIQKPPPSYKPNKFFNLQNYFKNPFNKFKDLPIYKYIFSNEKIMLSQLNDFHCVLWSVRSLTALVCEALNEEAYGVISNDINDIILLLLDFKKILEENSAGLMQLRHSNKYKYKIELRYCIVQCLYKIANTYSIYLDSLQLPKNALLQIKSLSKINITKGE